MISKSLAVLLVLVLASGISLTSEAVTPGELDVFTYWTGADRLAIEGAIDIFRLTHPGVIVNHASMAATEFKAKIAVELIVAPQDVYSLWNDPATAVYVERGALMDLTEFWEESGFDYIIPEDLRGEGFASVGGTIYLIPHVLQVRAAFYNKKLFEEHGIPEPPYETWEEFMDVLGQLRDIPGLKAPLIVATMGEVWGTQAILEHLLISQVGINFARRLAQGQESFKDARVVAAFQMYMDLLNAGYINADMFAIRFDEGLRAFGGGRAGIWWRATWGAAVLEREFGWRDGIEYKTFTPPSAGAFPIPALGGTDNWAIPADAQDPELAKEFIRTMVGREAQIAHSLVGGHGLPINKWVSADLYGPSKAAQITAYREEGLYGTLIALFSAAFLRDYTVIVSELVTGVITLDEAIVRFEEARKAGF